MRAFAACLTVVLGFGAFSAVGCSSDAKTGGTAGEAGEAGASPTAGSAGKPSGGAPGEGGAPGTAGATPEGGAAGAPASTCSFDQTPCTTCLQTKCGTKLEACTGVDACGLALSALEGCACDTSKTIDECKTTFGQDGGDPAAPLVTCYDDNCTTACE